MEQYHEEIWKPVVGYEGLYQVSNMGMVISSKTETILKQHPSHGYLKVCLSMNGRSRHHRVHRVVGAAFVQNPEQKPHINHKDGDKHNNKADNLEWVTVSENLKHYYALRRELISKDLNSYIAKVVSQEKQISKPIYCPEDGNVFDSLCEAARFYKMCRRRLRGHLNNNTRTRSGKTFKYIKNEQL